jgi:hypothetical protein
MRNDAEQRLLQHGIIRAINLRVVQPVLDDVSHPLFRCKTQKPKHRTLRQPAGSVHTSKQSTVEDVQALRSAQQQRPLQHCMLRTLNLQEACKQASGA